MRGLKRVIPDTAPTVNTAYRKFRTCERKKVYASIGEGWAAVRHIQKNGNDQFPDFELRPYKCEWCDKIHVGHSNTPKSSEVRMRNRASGQPTALHGLRATHA